VSIVDEDQDFELLDEESNLISYNDLCDMIKGIHEHIKVLESDGSYLHENKQKYHTLRKILMDLNESRSLFVRLASRPQGLRRRKNANVIFNPGRGRSIKREMRRG